ncbi:hypothetical protein D3C85_1514290 [compost metagenome]
MLTTCKVMIMRLPQRNLSLYGRKKTVIHSFSSTYYLTILFTVSLQEKLQVLQGEGGWKKWFWRIFKYPPYRQKCSQRLQT